jgi:hypothetical protein
MKIKSWELNLTWEDGEENEVGSYLPHSTHAAIQEFINEWEAKYGEDDADAV